MTLGFVIVNEVNEVLHHIFASPSEARQAATGICPSFTVAELVEVVEDTNLTIHKATPAAQFKDDAASTCIRCHKGIHKVPGGHGPTWVHDDTGAVAGPGGAQ